MLILKILGGLLLVLLGIILLLLFLIFFLLCTPAKVKCSYNKKEKFQLAFQYLWIKKQILPGQDDPDRNEEKLPDTSEQNTPHPQKNVPKAPAPSAKEKRKTAAEQPKDKRIPKTAAEIKEEKKKDAETAGGVKPDDFETAESVQDENDIFSFHLDKLGCMLKTAGGFVHRILRSLHYENVVLKFPVHGKDAADCALKFGRINMALNGFFNLCTAGGLRYQFEEARVVPDFGNQDTEGVRFSIVIRGRALWVLTTAIWAARQLIKEKILFPNGFPFSKKKKNKKDRR